MADNYDDYTREQLLRLLRERDRKPRFGLVWERDEIEHDKAVNDDFVALDFDPALSCGDAPFRNLIIEGDNFDALRFLRMTHAGKVKCIYIDPPYNTGNRDFIYNDRFIDKDDVYKHSKWLEFMYRRLLVAKELLAEDGVIFVSIDAIPSPIGMSGFGFGHHPARHAMASGGFNDACGPNDGKGVIVIQGWMARKGRIRGFITTSDIRTESDHA